MTLLPLVTTPAQALAVIDGALCLLDRRGGRSVQHAPLATAVVEFRRGALCTYVREHPFGLLPGLPNLYCLDGAHRLHWMAEWPDLTDPCMAIVGEERGELFAQAASGMLVRLDALTGKLIAVSAPVAVAS